MSKSSASGGGDGLKGERARLAVRRASYRRRAVAGQIVGQVYGVLLQLPRGERLQTLLEVESLLRGGRGTGYLFALVQEEPLTES